MKIKFFSILILTLSILLATLPRNARSQVVTNDVVLTENIEAKKVDQDIRGWKSVAENKFLILYIDEETANIAVMNKQSGTIWRSTPEYANNDPVAKGARKSLMKSHMQITFANYKKDAVESVNSFNSSSKDGNFAIENIKNGIKVIFTFKEQQFVVPMEFVLEEDNLSVTVVTSEIQENGVFKILKINLLPYFGAASTDDTGYFFVPDGMGALIDFNNGINEKYYQKIYSTNKSIFSYMNTYRTESVRFPVFGIKCGKDAMLAIITESDADATISAETSSAICSYNCVGAEFTLRYNDMQTYTTDQRADVYIFDENTEMAEKVQVKYHFFNGEKTGYEAMADYYRTYLINKYRLKKQTQTKNELMINLYCAALKKKTILMFDMDVMEPLTTYEQAVMILKEAEDKGIASIRVQFSLWSNETIKNNMLSNVKFADKLGGQKAYSVLKEYLYEKKIPSYNNFKLNNPASGRTIFSQFFDFAKMIRGTQALLYPYKLSTYEQDKTKDPTYLLGLLRYTKTTDNYINALKKNGITGVAFDDLAQILYSDFREKSSSMTTTKISVQKAMQSFDDQFTDTAGNTGNEYIIPYVDFITNAPTQSSMYDIENEEVPFYQMVIHGLIPYSSSAINLSSNPKQQYLKTIATGSILNYSFIYEDASKVKNSNLSYLYSSTYTKWIDTAAKQYKEMEELAQYTANQYMTGYQMLDQNVSQTTYENGVRVLVNFGDQDKAIAGNIIKAESFTVVRGDQ